MVHVGNVRVWKGSSCILQKPPCEAGQGVLLAFVSAEHQTASLHPPVRQAKTDLDLISQVENLANSATQQACSNNTVQQHELQNKKEKDKL